MPRSKATIVAALVASLLLAACGTSDEGGKNSSEKLPVAIVSDSAVSWPVFVIDAKNFDKDHDFDIDVLVSGGASQAVQLLLAGEADIAETTTEQLIRSVAQGARVRIAGASMLPLPYKILADPSISSIEQLQGATIALAAEKDPGTYLTGSILSDAGVPKDDWEAFYAGATPDRFAALRGKRADAALLTAPFTFAAERAGYAGVIDFNEAVRDYSFLSFGAKTDSDGEVDEKVNDYKNAYADAVSWLSDPANEEEAKSILTKRAKVDAADIDDTYAYFIGELGFAREADLPAANLATVMSQLEASDGIDLKSPSAYIAKP